MRIFVTGATGFVGSAVVENLLAAGHEVIGLARSDASADTLTARGAAVQRGSIDDLDSLRSGAAASDGVIHTAFDHDFSRFTENCRRDRVAIETLGAALAGSTRPLVVTSGLALHVSGRPGTEQDDAVPTGGAYPRASEATALELAAQGVRASVVRLPPTVHGAGDHGFVPMLIDVARRTGVSAYVGDGANHWSAVHRADAAAVFRGAVERAESGARYHAVAEEAIPFKAIATMIGEQLGVPVVALTAAEAAAHFTWMAGFVQMAFGASAGVTRRTLGWTPTHAMLADDVANAGYVVR